MEIEEAYNKWTVCRKVKHGYVIECRNGLWGVQAPTIEEAEREARHYFTQYFDDGEYATTP